MKRFYDSLHYLSFLQYPFLAIGLYYSFKPHIFGYDQIWEDINSCMTFMGVALSFTGFTDTSKKNKISQKVFSKPKAAMAFLIYLGILAAFLLSVGFFSMFYTRIEPLQKMSGGIMVMGIAVLSLLKMAIEIVQNHLAKEEG
ncbi:MAG: hypothetical protein MRZ79_14875 [Bacteroidia bacterium]|nr:hypothetical protein [Bacteroidia bacterium]